MLADPCLGLQNLQKGATLARRRAAGVNGEESFTSLPSRLGREEIRRCAMGCGRGSKAETQALPLMQ